MKKQLRFLFSLLLGAVLLLSLGVSLAEGEQPPLPEATPASSSTPASGPAPTPFSIAWLGDTQTAAWNEGAALSSMGCWIRDSREKENIVYVLQTGDMVENGFKQAEWDRFYDCYDRFAGDIPYLTISGNHDLGIKTQDYAAYLTQRFLNEVPEAQKFQGGKAVYRLFSAGGTDFIFLGVGYGAEAEATAWARDVLFHYQDRVAVLLFHDYLHPKYGLYYTGQLLYRRLVRFCPNVKLVLCGHYRGTAFRTDEIDDTGDGVPDRTVHTMMLNFQGYKRYNAQMRLLTFHPEDRTITVNTFNTMINRSYKDGTLKENPFVIQDGF